LTDKLTLTDLGWSAFFMSQLEIDEIEASTMARVAGVHRNRVSVFTTDAKLDLVTPVGTSTGDIAVGDWVLANLDEHRVERRLERKSTLQRGSEHHVRERQLIAANIDTLFITTSCNADFNEARLERYLALAHDAEVTPVILLTKADQCDDPESYLVKARKLSRNLEALALDARALETAETLSFWCTAGQTVALVGSSGVGKTTLTNALTGGTGETQSIREDDARGRHTTTGRSLHHLPSGGWLIDTPGMRGLGVADVSYGIDTTFPEISEIADQCRFRDCKHEGEPGCAVQQAIESGEVDPDRLKRFQKLKREDFYATETVSEARARNRKFTKGVKSLMKKKKR
jgi:ribosome biogenesis GTPase